MVLICFLSHLLSSVCSLSALSTAVYESHRSVCGLVISQKPSVWAYLLVTPFLAKKGGLRGKDHQFVPFFCSACYPCLSSPVKKTTTF